MKSYCLLPSNLGTWILEKGLITASQLEIARAEQRRLSVRESLPKPIQEVIGYLGYLDVRSLDDLIGEALVLPQDATAEGGIQYEAKRLLNAVLGLATGSNSTRANLEWDHGAVRLTYHVEGKNYEGPSLPPSIGDALRQFINVLIAEGSVNGSKGLSGSFGLDWESGKAVVDVNWRSEVREDVSFTFQYAECDNGSRPI